MAIVNGTSGDDTIDGNDGMTNGADIAFGKGGDDIIKGLGGADELFGGSGKDLLAGFSGDDVLEGGKGKDELSGGDDDDKLDGGKGKDRLDGNDGNDVLKGGKDADQFGFSSELNKSTNVDKIKDFKVGEDEIGLHIDIFSSIGGKLNKSEFVKGNKAKDGNDYIIYNKDTGKLYYDHDGKGGDGKVKFAELKGSPNGLDHNDFDMFS